VAHPLGKVVRGVLYCMGNRKDEMTVNTEVKGTLAKLLATENLKVEHRKISTACFDVHNRVLMLPIWKNASATVYDLLVGHEVGHALYTPDQDYDGAPKDFVNVLEDARIEKLMKRQYPGLRKSFFVGYGELWEQDFFGVKSANVSKLPLIDRINLYFKGNTSIEFAPDEQEYVARAAETNTFAEVVQLAKDLYGHAEEKQQEKVDIPETPDIEMPGGSSGSDDVEYSPTSPQEVEKTDAQNEMSGDQSLGSDTADSEMSAGGDEYDETQSVTEQALREALEDLVDDDAKEWVYLELPKIKLNEYVTSWKKIQEDLTFFYYGRAFSNEHQHKYFYQSLDFTINKFNDYKQSAQKSVNYLVKQFEMKKSADAYARASVSKTGVLDTNKLHTYRYNEDIFKKVTVIPDGKNHGLIMLLDWSGSMQHVLMDTLRQTYNLIWFCRKVNIPFRVYAFQSGYERPKSSLHVGEIPENTLHISEDFRLLEFFSSQMNTKAIDKQMQLIWAQAWGQVGHSEHSGHGLYGLGGTPLAEATMCMREAVNEMKKFEKVQKVNVISLTDGEANPMSYVGKKYEDDTYFAGKYRTEYLCHNRNKIFILRDPITGYSRRLVSDPYRTTSEIVSFFKEITNYNWIGIRLCSKHDLNRTLTEYVKFGEAEKYQKQWLKERFVALNGETGFTKQFFMPNQYIGASTEDIDVKQKNQVATKAELTRAFKKHMGSKMTNKTILNAFIEQIA
jgi:hypothetical protein